MDWPRPGHQQSCARADYFLIFQHQRVRNVFEVLYLLGQFFKICMLHLKMHTHQLLIRGLNFKIWFWMCTRKCSLGIIGASTNTFLKRFRWFSIARFRYNTVFKEMHAEKAIPIISRREQNHSQCCESVGTNLLKVSDRTWANNHMLVAPWPKLLELCQPRTVALIKHGLFLICEYPQGYFCISQFKSCKLKMLSSLK